MTDEGKSSKWPVIDPNLLRLFQIMALVIGVGMFIQQAKVSSATTAQNTIDIQNVQRLVYDQGIVLSRTVRLLDDLEIRMRANEVGDAANHRKVSE